MVDKFDLPKSLLARLIRVAVADDNGGAEGVREVRDLLRLPFLTGLGQVFKARTGGCTGGIPAAVLSCWKTCVSGLRFSLSKRRHSVLMN